VESTNDLVNNLMPGASDSHDNFLAVRGTEFSLHEFINGVSFLDNTQPQFSPGVSPQIFETVDLMTGGFTPNSAIASAAFSISPRAPAPSLAATGT